MNISQNARPAAALRTVLYADDHPDICEIVQTTLCLLAGLEVRTALSGEQALDLAYEFRPDLILMDVMMPGLGGPSTLQRLRKCALLRDIPVGFITAKVLPEEVANFLTLGVIGVIAKPFDPDLLCDQVAALWRGAATATVDRAQLSAEMDRAIHSAPIRRGMLQSGNGAI